jgi:hypothetical protein
MRRHMNVKRKFILNADLKTENLGGGGGIRRYAAKQLRVGSTRPANIREMGKFKMKN